jgi:hypothetical protein
MTTGATDGVPIACQLDEGSLATRLEEWRGLVASMVVGVDPGPTSLRLTLADSDDALVAAASLGRREKQCCAFFEVSIDIGPEQRALVLRVPDGAEETLASFASAILDR